MKVTSLTVPKSKVQVQVQSSAKPSRTHAPKRSVWGRPGGAAKKLFARALQKPKPEVGQDSQGARAQIASKPLEVEVAVKKQIQVEVAEAHAPVVKASVDETNGEK